MNMTRCMLQGMEVPRTFWAEAAQYAVYILNRSPTAAVGDVTLGEKWSNSNPTVEHLRVFGCVAYALVPYERRIKLDEKSTKCVMLGVSKESKAYRLYDPASKKIIISIDVKFDENKGWDWESKGEEGKIAWEGMVSDSDEEETIQVTGEENGDVIEDERGPVQ